MEHSMEQMSWSRKIGLLLSVSGVSLAILEASLLQSMNSLADPRHVFYSVAMGVIGAAVFVITTLREGKLELFIEWWAAFMAIGWFVVILVSPPLPTRLFWKEAKDPCSHLNYWEQLYNRPNHPPLDLCHAGGAR